MLFSFSAFLWDYLRRSGANGYFLPLSGGADSACSALIVYYLCYTLNKIINEEKN